MGNGWSIDILMSDDELFYKFYGETMKSEKDKIIKEHSSSKLNIKLVK